MPVSCESGIKHTCDIIPLIHVDLIFEHVLASLEYLQDWFPLTPGYLHKRLWIHIKQLQGKLLGTLTGKRKESVDHRQGRSVSDSVKLGAWSYTSWRMRLCLSNGFVLPVNLRQLPITASTCH